jgi:hypothetical protein
VAIHDNMRAFLRHAGDARAGSLELSAASSAVSTGSEYFIAQVFQPFILRCRPPKPQMPNPLAQSSRGSAEGNLLSSDSRPAIETCTKD